MITAYVRPWLAFIVLVSSVENVSRTCLYTLRAFLDYFAIQFLVKLCSYTVIRNKYGRGKPRYLYGSSAIPAFRSMFCVSEAWMEISAC